LDNTNDIEAAIERLEFSNRSLQMHLDRKDISYEQMRKANVKIKHNQIAIVALKRWLAEI